MAIRWIVKWWDGYSRAWRIVMNVEDKPIVLKSRREALDYSAIVEKACLVKTEIGILVR